METNSVAAYRRWMARVYALRQAGWSYTLISEVLGKEPATIRARMNRHERRRCRELRAWRAGLKQRARMAVMPDVSDNGDSRAGEWTPEDQWREFNELRE